MRPSRWSGRRGVIAPAAYRPSKAAIVVLPTPPFRLMIETHIGPLVFSFTGHSPSCIAGKPRRRASDGQPSACAGALDDRASDVLWRATRQRPVAKGPWRILGLRRSQAASLRQREGDVLRSRRWPKPSATRRDHYELPASGTVDDGRRMAGSPQVGIPEHRAVAGIDCSHLHVRRRGDENETRRGHKRAAEVLGAMGPNRGATGTRRTEPARRRRLSPSLWRTVFPTVARCRGGRRGRAGSSGRRRRG